MSLQNLRIVLVNPTHPGNIGGVARAMKNMSLQALWMVSPAEHAGQEARSRAAGADDLLMGSRICSTLDEALEECTLVIGTSARDRRIPWPALSPKEAATRLVAETDHGTPALVFGRERMGLTNDELDRCHFLVSIPANPDFPSLNLASAVQVMAYEIRLAFEENRARGDWKADHPPATQGDLSRLYEHLEQVLVEIGFLDPANPRMLMRRLMRLFNRVQLDQNELNIIRGILTAVQQRRREILDKNSQERPNA